MMCQERVKNWMRKRGAVTGESLQLLTYGEAVVFTGTYGHVVLFLTFASEVAL